MPNIKYDPEQILTIISEYMKNKIQPDELNLPIQELYDKIKNTQTNQTTKIKMPEFSQARKYIKEEMKKYPMYQIPNKLTSAKIHNFFKQYGNDNVPKIINHAYDISVYNGNIIMCFANLPNPEKLDNATKHYKANRYNKTNSKTKKERILYADKLKMIWRLCQRVKCIAPKTILAVIPEFNPTIYFTSDAKIELKAKALSPICNSICIIIKDNDIGKKLAKKIESPHYIYKAISKKTRNRQ